ncbi:hypothetical protein [Novosphingobium album (ex Liu et al. 2023)]|nr:hypothetical protein [Novosphingobium album (ex Liu et al. 2023)]
MSTRSDRAIKAFAGLAKDLFFQFLRKPLLPNFKGRPNLVTGRPFFRL